MSLLRTRQFHAALGSLVVAMGGGLAWDALAHWSALFVLATAASFLLWRGRTIGLVWAWSTLLLGVECFIWPIVTMIRLRSGGSPPSEEEMSIILSAVFMGLFSAVFWIAFSYGLFKRAGREEPGTSGSSLTPPHIPTATSDRPPSR